MFAFSNKSPSQDDLYRSAHAPRMSRGRSEKGWVIVPVELGLIPFSRKNTFMSWLAKEARRVNGHERWQKDVHAAIFLLRDIF
jgi:hypothetical protein